MMEHMPHMDIFEAQGPILANTRSEMEATELFGIDALSLFERLKAL